MSEHAFGVAAEQENAACGHDYGFVAHGHHKFLVEDLFGQRYRLEFGLATLHVLQADLSEEAGFGFEVPKDLQFYIAFIRVESIYAIADG